jgi:hypothetical protein
MLKNKLEKKSMLKNKLKDHKNIKHYSSKQYFME